MTASDIINPTTDEVINNEEPIKRCRGRPKRVVDVDRKIYYHTYYKTHDSPKQQPTDEVKVFKTADMKAYQKAYRERKKAEKLLSSL